MSTPEQHPQVTGDWIPADNTPNHIELAKTERPEVYALRGTFDTREVLFVTGRQIRNLAEAVEQGRMKSILR